MPRDIMEADFQSQVVDASADKRIIVEFYSQTCPPCKMLAETFTRIEGEADGSKVEVVKIAAEENMDIFVKNGISAVPVVKVYEKGEVIEELAGNQPEDKVRQMLLLG